MADLETARDPVHVAQRAQKFRHVRVGRIVGQSEGFQSVPGAGAQPFGPLGLRAGVLAGEVGEDLLVGDRVQRQSPDLAAAPPRGRRGHLGPVLDRVVGLHVPDSVVQPVGGLRRQSLAQQRRSPLTVWPRHLCPLGVRVQLP
ncbi:hypothetical protein AB0D42_27045 [Streptomyces sp. NPDC048304]|uniref:hypothetical protein n=1 Tax=Streptomyces sp. NPDC048304 TaxID=3154820 RepID=UPI003411EDDA